MTTTYYYPAGGGSGAPSTHIARLASDALQVSYTRDVTRFALNKYVQIRPVKVSTDYFMQLDPYTPARVTSLPNVPAGSFGSEYLWPRNRPRPKGVNNLAGWSPKQYTTQRRTYPFILDLKDEQEADWNIVAQNAKSAAQKAMTIRSQFASWLLSTPGNFGNNTATATALAGGKWTSAASATPYIQQSILAAVAQISLATNGVVQTSDLQLVLAPELAIAIAPTDEIRNYVKSQASAPQILMQGLGPGTNLGYGGYGLPEMLYGVKVVVEDAVVVTTPIGEAQVQSRIFPNTVATLVSRVGELVDAVSTELFSTITMFEKENMTVESKTEQWDRLTEGSVTDDFDLQLTAPTSGYCITGCQ